MSESSPCSQNIKTHAKPNLDYTLFGSLVGATHSKSSAS
jgi:hypothetical protein